MRALCCALWLTLAPTLAATPATMTLPGSNLDVTVSTDGQMSVRHKPTGRVYRSLLPPPPPTLVIRQAPTAWSAAAGTSWAAVPTIAIGPKALAEGGGIKDAADLSAQVQALWDPEGLTLRAQVADNQLAVPAEPVAQWWDHDSVELWLGGTQFGVSFSPTAAGVFRVGHAAEGCQATIATVPGGYTIVARIPWAAAGLPSPKAGELVRFAVGINDADAPGKRKAQLYYPATWRHSQPESFAVATLSDAEGNLARGLARTIPAVTNLRHVPGGLAFRRTLELPGTRPVAADLKVTSTGDADALQLTIDLPDHAAPFTTLAYPAPLDSDLPQGMLCFAPYMDGLALPQTNPSRWADRVLGPPHDLPFVGLYDAQKGDGYLLLLEDADDAGIKLTRLTVNGQTRCVPQAVWMPQKGAFGYARHLRLEFVPSGGYVAIAKRYRAYAAKHGLLKTFDTKLKERPQLARFGGCPDVWGGDLAWAREAYARGMEHCLLNFTGTKPAMQAVNDLGWLTSRYDNYADLLEEKDPAKRDNVRDTLDAVIVQANGDLAKGWLTWDKKTQYYERSAATAKAAAENYIPKDLKDHPYLARFLDVTTASGLYEDYSKLHPQTRTEDRLARQALAAYVNSLGLVTGGEHGRSWAVPYYDYFEGMMSGNPYFSWPAGHIRKPEDKDGKVSREGISQDYYTYGIGPVYRIPLWELVFHDCVVSYWYWGDSTDFLHSLDPALTDRKDAFNVLYGTPPMYWVSNVGFGRSTEAGWQRLMQSYRNTCRWHDEVLRRELLGHEFLTPDHTLQRTTFAGGYEAVANLGDSERKVRFGHDELVLPANGFVAKGPSFWLERRVADGRVVTRIRSPRYAFVDGGGKETTVNGLASSGRATVFVESPERLRVIAEQAATVNPAALCGGWNAAATRAFVVDLTGKRLRAAAVTAGPDGRWLIPAGTTLQLATGAETRPADLALVPADVTLAPARPKQGQPLAVRVTVRNDGGTAVEGGSLVARVDGREVARQPLAVPARQARTVTLAFGTGPWDGDRQLSVTAEAKAGQAETLTANNRVELPLNVALDRSAWPAAALRTLVVRNGEAAQQDAVVAVKLALPAGVTPAGVRVWDPQAGAALASQLEGTGGETTLVVRVPGTLAPKAERRLEVLAKPGEASAPGGGYWRADTQEVVAPGYRLRLTGGVVTDIQVMGAPNPEQPVISLLSYSNGTTGWVTEDGRTDALELVAAGPVRTVVRVVRNLGDGKVRYTKTYAFYPGAVEITTAAKPSLTACHNRHYFVREGDYSDELGRKGHIDGHGDDEIGPGGPVGWLAITGDGWSESQIPLGGKASVTYWDGGSWGGVGLNQTPELSRQVLVFHGGRVGPELAPLDAAQWQHPANAGLEG